MVLFGIPFSIGSSCKFLDTLRTHVEGLLHRRPEWEPELVGYHIESTCMVGKWEQVQELAVTNSELPSVLIAKVLLALRSGQEQTISSTLAEARRCLGAPMAAAGPKGYRRSYEAVLDLHLLHELQTICCDIPLAHNTRRHASMAKLDKWLSARLESTQPSFRFREPIISLRRTALSLR
jgi:serine/threonine-protein kinase ATR